MSKYKKFWKAQIGPHVQPSEPAWPAPAPEDLGDESGTTDVTGMDYLPIPVRKSFFDICGENPILVQAYENSELMKSVIDTIGNAMHQFEQDLVDGISDQAEQIEEYNKSLSEAVNSINDFIEKGNAKLEEIQQANTPAEVQKSMGGKVSYLPAPFEEGQNDAVAVRDLLVKAEQEGKISSQDILRFEMTGQIPERVQRHLG